jgi:antitoxin (DNA-binding transcriptional repressor) of toxin-antitoxin stability system
LYVTVQECTIVLVTTVSATDARASLPELLDRVEAGEEITITRHGRQVAVLSQPGVKRNRAAEQAIADSDWVGELLRRGRSSPIGSGPGLSLEYAEDLLAEVRASRNAR